jgi:trk system potassium uptake protein TrkH
MFHLPLLGVGGSQVFKAETPGPMKDKKLTPRIAETARGLWAVTFAIALACLFSRHLRGQHRWRQQDGSRLDAAQAGPQ